MTATEPHMETRDIIVDEVFPHAVDKVWRTLTTADLMARWMMPPTGFEATEGKEFTFQTKPFGAWDGTIHCKVLEVVQNRRLVYAWKGGAEGNVGYGSPLNTVVTLSLTPVEAGTRVRLVHSGFVLPKNDTAYQNMSEGWNKVLKRLDALSGENE